MIMLKGQTSIRRRLRTEIERGGTPPRDRRKMRPRGVAEMERTSHDLADPKLEMS